VVVLARSEREEDAASAESALRRLISDHREAAVDGRREAASAIAQIDTESPRFRPLLVPLMHDPSVEVARAAIEATTKLCKRDPLFVPSLVSLLGHRQLKGFARQALVSYGESVVDPLSYFLRDTEENFWVRRRVPGTLALIPRPKSVEALLRALSDEDGFIRYKAVAALEKLRHEHPELSMDRRPVEELAMQEAMRYFRYLGLHYNLFHRGGLTEDSLLCQALGEKLERIQDRLYRLLSLIHPMKDVTAARWAIEHGDPRSRASAAEYLDNLLRGRLRKRLIPVIEEMPIEDKVRRGNVLLKTRIRGAEETLARMIYDEDPVIAATAIDLVGELRLWSLADDLEQVLAFRDAKDWAVFEAASHALAAHRNHEARRASG
jgi:HEAT repeat protein